MRVAFTICAANYLAKAKVLGDSLLERSPGYRFVIVLVDRLTSIDAEAQHDLAGFTILPVEDLAIPWFESARARYDVVELSTAVKARCFQHLLRSEPDVEHVLYFDPDVMVLDALTSLEAELGAGEILLTPQILLPEAAAPRRAEFSALAGGVYNLGFLGLRPGAETDAFLIWWDLRLERHSRRQPSLGLFYDQSWANFVPVFFRNVTVSRHQGLNVAPWNIHERHLSVVGGRTLVNRQDPLVFIHFSHFDHAAPGTIAARDASCDATYGSRPDLAPYYAAYRERLLANRHEYFRRIPYAFRPERPTSATALVGALVSGAARLAKRLLPRSLVIEARRRLELV